MKSIIIKEVSYDASEEITEMICISRMNIIHKLEKSITPSTLDNIITYDEDDVRLSIIQNHSELMIEFSNDDEVITITIGDEHYMEVVIR